MTVDREELRRLCEGITRLGPPPRMDVACRLAAAVPSLLDEIDAADRRIAALESMRDLHPFEGRPCLLCVYDHGRFVRSCSMHAQITAMHSEIAELTARLATAHDMIRHYEQERDSWGAAHKQRAAMTDARIMELEALRDQLFRQRAQARDIIHALPSVMVAAIAERCRGSPLPCFCGCHVSQADSLLPSEETTCTDATTTK